MKHRHPLFLVFALAALGCSAPTPQPLPRAAAAAAQPAAAHAQCDADSCNHAPDQAEAQLAGDALLRIGAQDGMCMLSDRYLGPRADVGIEVEGKTYHGCCANCAARLGALAATRQALDPVSGEAVDKASAIIARDRQNRLYYFASEQTLAQYERRPLATSP